MRRGGGGQAKLQSRLFHDFLDQPWVQNPAPCAAKQRAIRVNRIRAGAQIGRHCITRRINHRHDPFLAALADDPDHAGQRHIGPGQPQCLGYPQAAAI